jgi:peptide/nickel transport system substrate-binding protein
VGFLREAPAIVAAEEDEAVNTVGSVLGAGGVALMNNGQITCKNKLPAAVCGDKPDGFIDLGKPTGDLRVRQAIAAAIDPKQLDQRMANGAGYPGSELFQQGPYAGLGATATYDPAKAKTLLDEYKKEKGWDGYLSVSCLKEQSYAQTYVHTLQAMLNSVGFNVSTDLKPSTEYITRIQTTRNYDIACWGFNIGDEAPEAGMSRHILSVAGGNAGGNAMNLNSPEIDTQVLAVRSAKTEADKKAAIGKFLDVWKQQMPSLFYSNTAEVIGANKSVHGLKYNVATSVLFDQAWVG